MKKMTFNGVASSLSEKEMENVMAGSGPSTAHCWLVGVGAIGAVAAPLTGWIWLASNAKTVSACWNS
jgi:hypothetical protein